MKNDSTTNKDVHNRVLSESKRILELSKKFAITSADKTEESKGQTSIHFSPGQKKIADKAGLKEPENPSADDNLRFTSEGELAKTDDNLRHTPDSEAPDPDLVDWATIKLLRDVPKGEMSAGDLKNKIDRVTGGKLSIDEINAVYDEAMARVSNP